MTASSEVKKKVKKEDNKKKEVKAGVGKSKKDEIIKKALQRNPQGSILISSRNKNNLSELVKIDNAEENDVLGKSEDEK